MSKRVIFVGFEDGEPTRVINHLHDKYHWDPVYILAEHQARQWAQRSYENAIFEDFMELRLGHFDYSRLGQFTPIDSKIIRTLSPYEGACYDLIEDSTGWNFSTAERRRFYYDTLRYWNTVIQKLKPDVCVFWIIPHVFSTYVLYLLCEHYYKIPAVFVEVGFYLDNYSAVHNKIEDLSNVFEKAYNSSEKLEPSTKVKEYLAGIRAKNIGDPKHIKDVKIAFKYSYLKAIFKVLKRIPYMFKKFHVAWKCNKHPWGSPKSQMSYLDYELWELQVMIKNEILHKMYSTYAKEPDLDKKYILFAASYQPEATTCPQAWPYDDLLLILDLLSASLPEDWIIYYKEYPKFMMFNKLSLWRSRQYYERIASLKNVKMIPSNSNVFELIDRSQAVATATGTAGWEAVVRGKPVLIFGSVWYGRCKGIFKIDTFQDCLDAMSKIRNGYKPDQADIERYAAAIEQSSYKLFIHSEFYRPVKSHTDKKYEMERLAQALYDTYEQLSKKH